MPTLSPGDIVIMDDLSAHNSASVRSAMEAAGASPRHLPPYSQGSNVMGPAFSTLEALLR